MWGGGHEHPALAKELLAIVATGEGESGFFKSVAPGGLAMLQ